MRRIVEAAGGILYRWKDDAEPTQASSPSAKSNIATDGTIIANTADSDGKATAAHGASDAAPTPDPTQADSPAAVDNVLNRIELCVVHRPKYDDWSWPKGKVDPNESHRHAAVREIGEESGLSVELGPYLGDIEYPLSEEGSKQRHTKDRSADTKHIQFWMATPISAIDNLRRTHAFGPVHRADIGEIDEVLWLTPAEARKKLSHSTDKDILALFVDRVQEGALDAVPVIIVRHGKAEARKLWKGSDANRPITPRGVIGRFASEPFHSLRASALPWRTIITGTASSAPSCTRSTNSARMSLSVEWLSFLRASAGVSHKTSSISPMSARCTGPNAWVRRRLSMALIGVAIQNWICLVSADRSLVWRCLLPSSDSGYSMSPR